MRVCVCVVSLSPAILADSSMLVLFIIYVFSVSAHQKTRTPAISCDANKVFGARHGSVLSCDCKRAFHSIGISFDIINVHMSGSKNKLTNPNDGNGRHV